MFEFTQPLHHEQNETQGQYLKSYSWFKFTFPSCLTKTGEPSLPYYLSLAEGKRDGFISFPRALVQSEADLSRIWTWVTNSISYNDNYYTKLAKEAVNVAR